MKWQQQQHSTAERQHQQACNACRRTPPIHTKQCSRHKDTNSRYRYTIYIDSQMPLIAYRTLTKQVSIHGWCYAHLSTRRSTTDLCSIFVTIHKRICFKKSSNTSINALINIQQHNNNKNCLICAGAAVAAGKLILFFFWELHTILTRPSSR